VQPRCIVEQAAGEPLKLCLDRQLGVVLIDLLTYAAHQLELRRHRLAGRAPVLIRLAQRGGQRLEFRPRFFIMGLGRGLGSGFGCHLSRFLRGSVCRAPAVVLTNGPAIGDGPTQYSDFRYRHPGDRLV